MRFAPSIPRSRKCSCTEARRRQQSASRHSAGRSNSCRPTSWGHDLRTVAQDGLTADQRPLKYRYGFARADGGRCHAAGDDGIVCYGARQVTPVQSVCVAVLRPRGIRHVVRGARSSNRGMAASSRPGRCGWWTRWIHRRADQCHGTTRRDQVTAPASRTHARSAVRPA
jgi:hypothetical protein